VWDWYWKYVNFNLLYQRQKGACTVFYVTFQIQSSCQLPRKLAKAGVKHSLQNCNFAAKGSQRHGTANELNTLRIYIPSLNSGFRDIRTKRQNRLPVVMAETQAQLAMMCQEIQQRSGKSKCKVVRLPYILNSLMTVPSITPCSFCGISLNSFPALKLMQYNVTAVVSRATSEYFGV
jgi:hypothetical protein